MTPFTPTRRRFLATSSFAAVATLIDARSLFAQDAPQPVMVVQGRATAATAKIVTQKLRGNVSALLGSGGNIAVLPGKDGKVLVDSGFSTSQPQITEALKALSADQLTHLVNTHWHFDHTDGNEWMHAAGATILASDKTRQRLATKQIIPAFHAEFPPAPAGALPTMTFTAKHIIQLNGSTLVFDPYEPAHTDTDISIYFTEANVLHTGDTWFNGFYPYIDYATGGTIGGMIRATKKNLAIGTADTIIIPGHGPIGNKTQLAAFLEMLSTVRGHVAELKKKGKTLEETIAANPTAAYDDPWGKGFMNPAGFVGLVYQGV